MFHETGDPQSVSGVHLGTRRASNMRNAHGIGVAQSSCLLAGGLATVILAQPAELTDALGFAAKSPDIRGILVLPGAHTVRNDFSAAVRNQKFCLPQRPQTDFHTQTGFHKVHPLGSTTQWGLFVRRGAAYTKHDSNDPRPCSLASAGPVPEEGLSDAAVFPGAAYAPYPNSSYVWNPRGSGMDWARIDVPVTLLSGSAAADARRRASGNALQVRQLSELLRWVSCLLLRMGMAVRCASVNVSLQPRGCIEGSASTHAAGLPGGGALRGAADHDAGRPQQQHLRRGRHLPAARQPQRLVRN